MGKILIGWAEKTLVPENKKLKLAGQFYERISEYVESEITATAMAIECDGDSAIMVSCDLTSIPQFLIDLARKKIRELRSDIDPMKVTFTATHTHTSHTFADPASKDENKKTKLLAIRDIMKEYMPKDVQYKELVSTNENVLDPKEATVFVAEQIALAVAEAWDARVPASFANEFGRVPVGMCRRVEYDDGTAAMWGDSNTANFIGLEGGNDSGMELLYTFDGNKQLTGVVANIACPSQILEQRSFISADFWGRAKANIRSALGKRVHLLALGGAGGDQCPRDLVRWVEPETPIDDPNVSRPNPLKHKGDPSMYDISGCNKAGRRISNEILSVLDEVQTIYDEAVFCHKTISMDLPLRKATRTEYEHAVRELELYGEKCAKRGEFNFADTAKAHVHAGLVKRFREQQRNEVFTIECHIIRLGSVAIITNPFELFLDFGLRIKARSVAEQTFIAQLTCGQGGYLPTEKAERGGHYSAYISSGNVGHIGGDLYVRECLKEIENMFS